MAMPSATHLDADFSTRAGWEAWCRAQDGGSPSAKHDLRREPEVKDGSCVRQGFIVLLAVSALFWAGVWCGWRWLS